MLSVYASGRRLPELLTLNKFIMKSSLARILSTTFSEKTSFQITEKI